MNSYLMKILTPEKKIYSGRIISMTATCENGLLTVLAGHAPMTAMLVEGPLVVKTEQETLEGITGQGVLCVDRSETVVMTHTFQWAGDESEAEPDAAAASDTLLL